MTITISPKYQITIPKKIRELSHITPGMKFEILPCDNGFHVVKIRSMQELRGVSKGINTDNIRDKNDRF